jgi:hypothetical protein
MTVLIGPRKTASGSQQPLQRGTVLFGITIDALRRMDWMTGSRARGYRLTLFAVTLFAAIAIILTAHHGIDRMGKPLGTDFLAFWSASKLALAGRAAGVYDLAQLYKVERATVPVDPGLSSFLYPPPFLLLCLPLALAPYFAALAGWLAATGTAYWLVARRWLGSQPPAVRGATMTILAFPAVLMNIGHGQNGFLTCALLGGGLWLMDRRPWLAGALLGMLIVKPQVALAVPVLVFAGGRWRLMLAGIASALTACAASWAAFGPSAWQGFLAGSATGRAILEQGLVQPGKMVSVFAAVRVLHGGAELAYAAQALSAIGAVGILASVVRGRGTPPLGHAAVCVAATTLISPFFLDYDLIITAVPLAWLLTEGQRRGFLPWEKLVLLAGYLLPLVARDLALHLGVPIGPLVMMALLMACARAAMNTQESCNDHGRGENLMAGT